MTKQAAWTVVVVYENAETRETAMAFCDRLVERFWNKFEFDVSWWSFDLLEHRESTREASEKAVEAALVVFATRPEGEMPRHVRAWVERWLPRRGDREGAVVGLVGPGAGERGLMEDRPLYLRSVALRAGMDYLTQVPQSIAHYLPDYVESCTQRAHQMTSVLDEILHQHQPPPGVAS